MHWHSMINDIANWLMLVNSNDEACNLRIEFGITAFNNLHLINII